MMSINVKKIRVNCTIKKILKVNEKTIIAQNIKATCNEININIF